MIDIKKNNIQTSYGQIDPFEPDPLTIDIRDIAHALSRIPRFNGHLQEFYSVAQHSLYVSVLVGRTCPESKQKVLDALLHDASEAYLCDVPRPIKRDIRFGTVYSEMEAKLMEAISNKFYIDAFPTDDALIYDADIYASCMEAITYMRDMPLWAKTQMEEIATRRNWDKDNTGTYSINSVFLRDTPLEFNEAERLFLQAYNTLVLELA